MNPAEKKQVPILALNGKRSQKGKEHICTKPTVQEEHKHQAD